MKYLLITPAKNEEAFIEKTIVSVSNQTVLPCRWVIVSDGSTDNTDKIVSRFAEQHDFIQLVRRESTKHCFGSKVHAFREGVLALGDIEYEFIGNLDADIELPENYYEFLLHEFAKDKKLGLAGGTRYDLLRGEFVKRRFNELNIGGAYQLFRRTCYDQINGYRPLKSGGVDTVAGIMARQQGWRVRAFRDIEVLHLRPTGVANGNLLRTGLRTGKKNYAMGYHPLFELLRLLRVRRSTEFIHNLSELAGFVGAALRGVEREIPSDAIAFLRAEQLSRLKQMFYHFRDPASGERNLGQSFTTSIKGESIDG